jgi:hypothetical protein
MGYSRDDCMQTKRGDLVANAAIDLRTLELLFSASLSRVTVSHIEELKKLQALQKENLRLKHAEELKKLRGNCNSTFHFWN